MKWFVTALKKYAVLQGRSRRREYWYYMYFATLFLIVATVTDKAIGDFNRSSGLGSFGVLATLFLLAPTISVGVRRLHDIDRSGWWLLLGLIPLIGPIILLLFNLTDGGDGENRFGQDPKGSLS